MSKGAAIANALAQGINGYFRGMDYTLRAEREKEDAGFRNDERNRQRQEWAAADKLETDLKDAAADRVTMQGTVTEGGGQKLLNTDPSQAAAIQDTLAAEAELKGEAAPTQRQGSAITGKLSTGSEITDTPADVGQANTPDARNERIAGALRKNGKIERAVSMESSMLDQQAKRLGLDSAQAQFADEQFNRKLNDTFATNPDWTTAAAKVLTETQVSGLSGVTVVPKLSADGKKVEFVGTKDGAEGRTLASFANTDEGRAKFLAQAMRAPLHTKIGFLVEGFRADRAQANADRDFDLRKQGQENDQQYRQRMLSFQAAQEGRARQSHAAAMEDAKIPPAVKLQAQTLAKQMEGVSTALNKAMAEGMFDPNNPNSAALLKTQADLGIAYQKLLTPYTPKTGGASGVPDASVFDKPAGAAAPAAAPAPSSVPQRPGAAQGPMVGMFGGAVPPPQASAPAAPARAPATVAEILAGPSASGSIAAGAQQRAQVVEALAAQVKSAQAAVAETARANPQAVGASMQQVTAARAELNAALQGMNEQQARQVLAAVGLQ